MFMFITPVHIFITTVTTFKKKKKKKKANKNNNKKTNKQQLHSIMCGISSFFPPFWSRTIVYTSTNCLSFLLLSTSPNFTLNLLYQ